MNLQRRILTPKSLLEYIGVIAHVAYINCKYLRYSTGYGGVRAPTCEMKLASRHRGAKPKPRRARSTSLPLRRGACIVERQLSGAGGCVVAGEKVVCGNASCCGCSDMWWGSGGFYWMRLSTAASIRPSPYRGGAWSVYSSPGAWEHRVAIAAQSRRSVLKPHRPSVDYIAPGDLDPRRRPHRERHQDEGLGHSASREP